MDKPEVLHHNGGKWGHNIVLHMDNGKEHENYSTMIGYIGVCGNKQYDVTAAMQ